jgi:endo-1,4-beta-D-glucanase Y
MFFALVDNDRVHFDKLLQWTEANLAGGDLTLRLPAWNWGHNPAGAWTILDENSASDADLWMAYDLLEAGRLWHEPRYARLGAALASRIAQQETVEVKGVGTWLTPGSLGFHPTADTYIVNPSYMPLPLLERLAHVAPAGPWKAVIKSLPTLLEPTVGAGFAMDWVAVGKAGVLAAAPPAQGSPGQQAPEAAGSYEAIRVYLWAGMTDPATPGERTILSLLTGMKDILDRTGNPPEQVSASGRIIHAQSPIGFSAAVIPYLNALGDRETAKNLIQRLSAARDGQTGLVGKPATYYDQNLSLFSTGFTEGRFHFRRDGQLSVNW